MSKKNLYRNYAMIAITIMCIIDYIVSIIRDRLPYFADFLRPLVILVLLTRIRGNIGQVINNVRDSIAILFAIIFYITFFSIIGFFLFQGTLQGFIYFNNISNTFYQMQILFTTSNFPDIMLPAYQTSTFYVLFFFIYLMFGIYFLFNTLLATIFTNYKKRLELRVEKRESQRQLFLERHFDELDKEKKGWLNENEAKKFFQTVFDFDYSERAD